jgi:type I restriction enzyme S subunit
VFSHDLIRLTCKNEDDTGYLYAFLKTSIGNALIRTNEYGAVVKHIEPQHLESVPIPDPPPILKRRIHELVVNSYGLRDESNALLRKAERLLFEALNLPPMGHLRPRYFDKTVDLRNYAVTLSDTAGRLDASYHVPTVRAILQRLKTRAGEITTVGDPRVSKRVILPGRFARVYVQEGQGVPFFGGRQLFQLDPANKKYLSLKHHGQRIQRELKLEENMVLLSCSGTIGKVVLVPEHWEGWAASQHVIRVVPASDDVAGYLSVFLATEYGRELITRFTYGSVVDEIDDHHVCQVPVPLLKEAPAQAEINRLALEANAKRTEAYRAEQEAIRITRQSVLGL